MIPSVVNEDQFAYSDFSLVWEEIREFAEIDCKETKILVLAKDWNIVVGTFDVLFSHAEEKLFCQLSNYLITELCSRLPFFI